jgi:glycosyltransferase involved in cell wall biosynthesis
MPVSRRSETLADRLGYDVELLARPGFRNPVTAVLTYPLLAFWTIRLLIRRRPSSLVIVAPPVVAPLVAVPTARLLGARVALDVHSGALLDHRWRWSIGLLAVLARVGVAVVTLPRLAALLERHGVATAVIPDPVPTLTADPHAVGPAPGDDLPHVTAVCGWGDDEPIENLVEAARGQPWRLAVTGRPRREISHPANVTMTGFLAGRAYVNALASSAAIVVLTTREDTLLSGAWEALALARPLVLSDTVALRDTFGDGPVYVDASPGSIARGIAQVLADPEAATRSRQLAERFRAENDAAIATLARRWLSPVGDPPPGP